MVIESQELLAGQKRGIAAALTKARTELTKLDARVAKGTINKTTLQQRVNTILRNEHLGSFVVVNIGGEETAPTFSWRVDAGLRRELERTRLGRRVLCTDRHTWSTERILWGFRGQWKVEELFRRSKGGGHRSVGAFASMVRRFDPPSHVCRGAGPNACEPRAAQA